jgi:hypothetical protein
MAQARPIDGFTTVRHTALGHDHQAKLHTALVALIDLVSDDVQVIGHLGDEDDIGAHSHASRQGDPAGVTPHHPIANDHDFAVACAQDRAELDACPMVALCQIIVPDRDSHIARHGAHGGQEGELTEGLNRAAHL